MNYFFIRFTEKSDKEILDTLLIDSGYDKRTRPDRKWVSFIFAILMEHLLHIIAQ